MNAEIANAQEVEAEWEKAKLRESQASRSFPLKLRDSPGIIVLDAEHDPIELFSDDDVQTAAAWPGENKKKRTSKWGWCKWCEGALAPRVMEANQYGKGGSVLECAECMMIREEPVSAEELSRFPRSCLAREKQQRQPKFSKEVHWGRCPLCSYSLKLIPPVNEKLGGFPHLGCSNWRGKPGGKCRGFLRRLTVEEEGQLPEKLFVSLKRKYAA